MQLKRPQKHLISLSLLSLVAACSGGSGAGNGTTAPPAGDNFGQDAFGYEDPNPAAFHPLGAAASTLTQLDEAMIFFNQDFTGVAGLPGPLRLREDALQGSAQLDINSAAMAKNGFVPLDACTGDLDGDGRIEAIFTGIVPGEGSHTGIRVSQPGQNGTAVSYENADTEEWAFNGWWTGVIATHCAAGDLDGDGTDELLIMESRANETQLRVLKLVYDGGIPVFSDVYTAIYSGPIGRVAVGQFDSDDALELVVAHGFGGKPASLTTDLLDDLNTGMAFLEEIAHYTGNDYAIEIAVGDFDGDALDEITLAVQTWLSTEIIFQSSASFDHFRTWTNAYDYSPSSGSSLIRATAHDTFNKPDWEWDAIGRQRRERFVVADLNNDGVDEVCWLHVELTNLAPIGDSLYPDWRVLLRTWQPVSNAISDQYIYEALAWGTPFSPEVRQYRGGDLAVVDNDGSGDDNILVTVTADEQDGLTTGAYQVFVDSPGNATMLGFLGGIDRKSVPIMAGGDFDGEGLRVKYTGVKYQHLPDPIPMVLLAAPPTKAGSSQNTFVSGSSYTVSDGVSEAYTVSTSTSMSFSVGYEVEDITGNFGASMKATVKSSVDKSTGQSSTLTTSQVFSGSYDKDSIVFEGTLFTLYEYEVVSALDPSVIGSIISVNVPVATKVFKWTTDFFNQNVDASQQIPTDVFTHTIGDPTSYPTESALKGLLASNGGSYEGWEGTSITVGQGGASNGIGLAMESVLSEGETHTFGVEAGIEFKVGGPTYGASVGVSSSSMYEVSVSRATSFDGTIGDLEASDWGDWFYDVGMVVYTRSDADEKPFQVLQYWTEPLGSEY